MNNERELFEKLAVEHGMSVLKVADAYSNDDTNYAWWVWQKARATSNIKPVAWRYQYVNNGSWNHTGAIYDTEMLDYAKKEYPQFNIQPLFTHPPASVPVEDAKVRDLILELKCLGEVLAMEMTTIEGNPIAPIVDDAWKTIERLVATQSASVPLEKYNKLLDALKDLFADYKTLADSGNAGFWKLEETEIGKRTLQAIAEAEGKEG